MGTFDGGAHSLSTPQYLLRWLLVLTGMVFAGGTLIPLARTRPEAVHAFFLGVHDWQRATFVFAICTLLAFTAFKLFSPRWAHLRYAHLRPPIWLACLSAAAAVGAIDLGIGLSPGFYTASLWEWAGYAGGSVLAVAVGRALLNARNVPALNAHRPAQTRLRAPVDWQSTEAWLSADGTAELDLLGNYAVAERLAAIVTSADGARSIGIVGAFGAGKSTIVEWMRGIVEREKNALGLTVVFSTHSCWGFDNSASAIHEILADAVKRVGEHIDTFYVSSLPESYVRAFSTSGKWADGLSRLFLRARGPIEQFQSLSDLLRCANARLVFIIEDLDRNESRSFDGQEILAFLQQLKTFANFSFVLTGGLAANGRVDYSKLCEHIEYLSAVNVRQAMELVRRVRGGCLASAGGPRETFATPFDDVWSETLPVLTEPDLLHPRGAVASLLGTPRALQRVLARTHRSWGRLAGEIDFDSLLAVNVLRDAAHEAFSFVLRNWQMLRAAPPDRALAAR